MRTKSCCLLLLLVALSTAASAQIKLTLDTLQCPIVGFRVGTLFPSSSLSMATAPDGSHPDNANLYDLYSSPWLSFGVDGYYKLQTNWLFSLEGELIIGNYNLRQSAARLGDLYTHDSTPIVIGSNGTNAGLASYNRALALKLGVGKIFTLTPRNPNSGPFVKLNAGWMQNQTIFTNELVHAPQIEGDYALLYDHQRRGFTLSENIGFWYMRPGANLVNFYIAFEVTQCWSRSTRDYVIDNLMGLHGKDNNRYFDLLYSIKICWMFPLSGKKSYDYYF
ncbi:MAG: hypothetical protein IJ684_04705 [Bacteroidales bacterium]|nr:hypothetical protein [Bacteroidales bacterium]